MIILAIRQIQLVPYVFRYMIEEICDLDKTVSEALESISFQMIIYVKLKVYYI
jgi:hypothetical protein